jgi:hypothetical protein
VEATIVRFIAKLHENDREDVAGVAPLGASCLEPGASD